MEFYINLLKLNSFSFLTLEMSFFPALTDLKWAIKDFPPGDQSFAYCVKCEELFLI